MKYIGIDGCKAGWIAWIVSDDQEPVFKVVKALDSACDAEVIRVMESMNSLPDRWTPGMNKGEKVRVEYAIPVMFRLN